MFFELHFFMKYADDMYLRGADSIKDMVLVDRELAISRADMFTGNTDIWTLLD